MNYDMKSVDEFPNNCGEKIQMTLRWVQKKGKTSKITVLTKPWENWENLKPNTHRDNACVANPVFH